MKARTYKKKVSYIISVSLGTGCYRHIRVSGKDTLDDLAGYILDAFDFDFDHLYSFFMDNQWWSNADRYHSPYDEEPPYADQIKLAKLNLQKGQAFKFLFDYGDEWRFQCKVLQVLDEETPDALIVRSKGKAPEQYPVYDEETDDDYYPDTADETPDRPLIQMTSRCDTTASDNVDEPEFMQKPLKIPDELMEAAFRFRSEKLWKKLYDTDIFAVKLSNGEIGYCCVMGNLGECLALALYIGDEGLYSLRFINEIAPKLDSSFAILLEQSCLQLGLDNKSDLPDEVILPVQAYAKTHGISLKGKKSYPNFMNFQRFCAPWYITAQDDYKYLLEALHAAHEVAEQLKTTSKVKIGLGDAPERIPLLTPCDSGFKWTLMELPEMPHNVYPAPVFENALLLQQLQTLKKQGTWECGHFITSHPHLDHAMQKLVYPSLMLIGDKGKKKEMQFEHDGYYPEIASSLIEELAIKIVQYGTCPKNILTNSNRSHALLSDFCEKCGITLKIAESFTMIDKMLDRFLASKPDPFTDERLLELFAMLDSMSMADLRTMPQEMMEALCEMIGEGILPESLEKKLKAISKK